MAGEISVAYTWLSDVFQPNLFQIDWLVTLIFIILTMLLITRDFQKWQILFLPVTIFWHILGLQPSIIIYAIGAIMFAVHALSLEILGQLVQGVGKTAGKIITGGARTGGRIARTSGNMFTKQLENKRIRDMKLIRKSDDLALGQKANKKELADLINKRKLDLKTEKIAEQQTGVVPYIEGKISSDDITEKMKMIARNESERRRIQKRVDRARKNIKSRQRKKTMIEMDIANRKAVANIFGERRVFKKKEKSKKSKFKIDEKISNAYRNAYHSGVVDKKDIPKYVRKTRPELFNRKK